MKSKGITNHFIIKKLFFYPGFKGVYSRDEIKNITLLNGDSIIINWSKKGKIGTHFIAIVKKKNILYHFDPLALYIEFPEINDFLFKHKIKIIELPFALQHKNSYTCGYFCITFVCCIFRMSFKKFCKNFFKHNKRLNDTLVTQFTNKIRFS